MMYFSGYESLHSTPKQMLANTSKNHETGDDETRTSSDADVNLCPSTQSTSGQRQTYLKHFKDAKMQTVDIEDSNGDTEEMSNMSFDTSSVKWTEEFASKIRNSSIIRKFRLCSGGNEERVDCDSHQCKKSSTNVQNDKHSNIEKVNSSVVVTSKGNKCTLNPTSNNGVDDEDMDIEDGSSVKQMDNGSIASDFEPRIEWNKKMDFLLSIIGFAVDLANVSNAIVFLFNRFDSSFHSFKSGLAISLPLL